MYQRERDDLCLGRVARHELTSTHPLCQSVKEASVAGRSSRRVGGQVKGQIEQRDDYGCTVRPSECGKEGLLAVCMP